MKRAYSAIDTVSNHIPNHIPTHIPNNQLNNQLNNRYRKKRKLSVIENKLRDGIISPPKITNYIKPVEGSIKFTLLDYNYLYKKYNLNIFVDKENINYYCDCKISTDRKDDTICKHMRATIIFILLNFIGKYNNTDVDELINNFNLNLNL